MEEKVWAVAEAAWEAKKALTLSSPLFLSDFSACMEHIGKIITVNAKVTIERCKKMRNLYQKIHEKQNSLS